MRAFSCLDKGCVAMELGNSFGHASDDWMGGASPRPLWFDQVAALRKYLLRTSVAEHETVATMCINCVTNFSYQAVFNSLYLTAQIEQGGLGCP